MGAALLGHDELDRVWFQSGLLAGGIDLLFGKPSSVLTKFGSPYGCGLESLVHSELHADLHFCALVWAQKSKLDRTVESRG